MSKKDNTKEAKAVVVRTRNAPALQEETKPFQMNPEVLIGQAIEKGLPVETMERLLSMRKDLKAEWAKEQYDKAMANFQMECPVIKKKAKVNDKHGKERYGYAKLDDIVSQTKNLIAQNGFSYKIEVENDEKFLTANCVVTHKDGHKEVSPFKVPISTEEYMTDVQKYGARSTFAKRYAFCNAFGIITGDDDNDGNVKGKAKPETTSVDDKMKMIMKAIQTQKDPAKIIEIEDRTAKSPEFSEDFKAEIHRLASSRVDELDTQAGK